MKLLKSPAATTAIAWLISSYLKLCYVTVRWRKPDMGVVQPIWDRGGGVFVCVWHECSPMGPTAWPNGPGRQAVRNLASRSADGELMAQIMVRLGLPSFRGSANKKTADGQRKQKDGEGAFRQMAAWVKAGNAMAVTPDGPRGPVRAMGEGVPMLARTTGAPVVFAGIACGPCFRLKTWDRTIIPIPFAKAALTYSGPVFATRQDDLAALAAEWRAMLNETQARAEQLVAD